MRNSISIQEFAGQACMTEPCSTINDENKKPLFQLDKMLDSS